jgi:hypothetical protein
LLCLFLDTEFMPVEVAYCPLICDEQVVLCLFESTVPSKSMEYVIRDESLIRSSSEMAVFQTRDIKIISTY